MDTLSNNRGNAAQVGLWYVNANNAPSNVNANNWGSRPSPQSRRQSRVCSMNLNRVERHLLRLLNGDPNNLSEKGKAALASLYGYIKNGDSLTLKELWRAKNANRVFQQV